eukprot:2026346-Rhodomonas_salina.2
MSATKVFLLSSVTSTTRAATTPGCLKEMKMSSPFSSKRKGAAAYNSVTLSVVVNERKISLTDAALCWAGRMTRGCGRNPGSITR